MMHAGNQKTISVNRVKLILKLKENRVQHKADYEEAVIGYRIKLKADLLDALSLLEDSNTDERLRRINVQFSFPSNYDKEYENAIAMLEWSVSENIDLDQSTFQQYIQNEWSWSRAFEVMNTTYKSFAAGAVGAAGG